MWRALDDPQLLSAYRSEFAKEQAPGPLLDLLSQLSTSEAASRLHAATSLGSLRLTTAADHTQASKHPAVSIVPHDEQYAVAYHLPGATKAAASRRCSSAELADVVQTYLLRLSLEQG